MIEDVYGLHAAPFRLAPDPRFFYASQTHKKALSYLEYGLQQGEGFIVLTGDVGTGKSMLIAHLLDRLPPDRVVAVPIVITSLEAHDALRMIATTLNLHPAGDSKGQLLAAIQDFLEEQERTGRQVLLIVDEAQNLPAATLEELRMLTNLQAEAGFPLQCFLIGQQQFREIMARPEFEQLRQRVIASCHLEPLSLEETFGYLEHRMRIAGWKGRPTFGEGVTEMIHEASGGIPRRINLLFSRLLLLGALEERDHLDEEAVKTAIADLEAESGPALPPSGKDASRAAPASQANGEWRREFEALATRVDDLEAMLLEIMQTTTALLHDMSRPADKAAGKDGDETPKQAPHEP